ncbi:MAG: hypothetical protein ACRDWS_03285 [Acidimicrobiia bacterium]
MKTVQRTDPLSSAPAVLLEGKAVALAAAKHPLTVAGFAISGWLLGRALINEATVWQFLAVSFAGWLLPLAGAAFLVACWTASTEIRYAYEEHLDSLPHGRTVRALGLLGGVVGPLAYAFILALAGVVAGLFLTPAGSLTWHELASGFLVVCIAWFAGIALGRSRRVRATPVLVLLIYATLQLLGSPDVEVGAPEVSGGSDLSRLLLWMPPSAFDTPFDVFLRPSGPRIFFLLSVALLTVVLVMTRSSRRIRPVSIASAGAASLLVVATALQVLSFVPDQPWAVVGGSRPRVDWEKQTSVQECLTVSDRLYCPYPGFEPWVAEWHEVADGVSEVLTADLAVVAQRPQNSDFPRYSASPNGVATFFTWDRPGSSRPIHAFALASRIAHVSVGLPGGPHELCDARGQGRVALALWIAAASVDGGAEIVTAMESAQGSPAQIEGDVLGGAVFDSSTIALAQHLVTLDPQVVASVIEDRMSQLARPEVTLQELAALFGVNLEVPEDTNRPNAEPIPTVDTLLTCD